MGYADSIRLLAKSCGADIQRYCPNAALANFGIGDCLRENGNRISNACASDLTIVARSLTVRAEAQANAERLCDTDIRRLCPMTEAGRGRILRCLITAERSVSERCNKAITDAGWR